MPPGKDKVVIGSLLAEVCLLVCEHLQELPSPEHMEINFRSAYVCIVMEFRMDHFGCHLIIANNSYIQIRILPLLVFGIASSDEQNEEIGWHLAHKPLYFPVRELFSVPS